MTYTPQGGIVSGLEHIFRKVEAGERLREGELGLLEREAQRAPTLNVRLAVAHALLNDDRASEGLARVEALRRDYPAAIDVQLARARALSLLERYGAAEAELRSVLSSRPDDPEALKAWALLRLRRGELGPARAIAARVLERDPFDGEAQLMHAELEAASGQPDPELIGDERAVFRAALFARLGQLGVSFRPQGDGVLVRSSSGRPLRVGFEAQLASTEGDVRERASQLAEGLASLAHGMPESAEALAAQVLPVLVGPEGAAQRPGALQAEAPAGLSLLLVVEHPELMLFVPHGLPTALASDPAALFTTALARLEARPAEPFRLPGTASRVWTWAEGDGGDTARLLCASQLARVEATVGQGPWHVALLDAEHVAVCRAADFEARADLAQLARGGGEGARLLVLSAEGELSALPIEPSA